MNSTLLEDGLNALRTRGFAGEREGQIKLISLRHLSRQQVAEVFLAVEEIGAAVNVAATVSGIGHGPTVDWAARQRTGERGHSGRSAGHARSSSLSESACERGRAGLLRASTARCAFD